MQSLFATNSTFNRRHEDFNMLRQISRQLVRTDFIYDWNFRLDIQDAPTDLDFYVKDLTVSGFDLNTEEEHYGLSGNAWPGNDNVKRLSMTVRDNFDARIMNFFADWIKRISIGNGDVGLPYGNNGYVRSITVYNIDIHGREKEYISFEGYPTQIGEMSRSRENGNFMELPVTITQFSVLKH